MATRADGPVLLRVADRSRVAAVLAAGGVDVGVEVVVFVGGADGMDDAVAGALGGVWSAALFPAVLAAGATVIDGGTDSGVMRSIGRARAGSGMAFPLVGVAAEGTVTVPGGVAPRADAADPEPNHTHVLLVPGNEWGAEALWISEVAGVVAAGRASVTLLINGGGIAVEDAELSLEAGRPLVVVAGSGRTADAIADARGSGSGDLRVRRIAASPLTRVARLDEPESIASALAAGLAAAAGHG